MCFRLLLLCFSLQARPGTEIHINCSKSQGKVVFIGKPAAQTQEEGNNHCITFPCSAARRMGAVQCSRRTCAARGALRGASCSPASPVTCRRLLPTKGSPGQRCALRAVALCWQGRSPAVLFRLSYVAYMPSPFPALLMASLHLQVNFVLPWFCIHGYFLGSAILYGWKMKTRGMLMG